MLPIHEIAEDIAHALRHHSRLVLSAPTGSGKTTQVPQILLRRQVVEDRILVLQPRRLACRLVATRVAAEMGGALGDVVGYQTRHDRRAGPATRILFLTEGIFLRMLLSDPVLPGVGAVILDEFHERSLTSDLSLGLVRRLQETQRPNLRLVVMSATLDVQGIAGYLDGPALEAGARSYPVDIEYLPQRVDGPVWEAAARAVRSRLDAGGEGDLLVFMPGAYEIRRTVEACQRQLRSEDGTISVLPLHGSLPAAKQDAAVTPGPHRKIIVATNVAETSITIEGIHHVVDSGLARVHRFDSQRGLNVLLTENISRASADQRAGRAGRTAPGTCLRMWPRSERFARPERDLPEIQRLDLTEAVLQLHAMGAGDIETFLWLDPPEPRAVANAARLLEGLGALDPGGTLTDTGRAMAAFPMHPRLSRLLVEARRRGCLRRAALWAALIGERDILTRPPQRAYTDAPEDLASDLLVRERALDQARRARFDPRRCADLGLQFHPCREVDRVADQFCRLANAPRSPRRDRAASEDLARCLLVAYFDNVARRRPDSLTCEMPGRRRVVIDRDSAARDAEIIIAVDMRETEAPRSEGGGVHTVLSLATGIELAWLEQTQPDRLAVDQVVEWNTTNRAVERVEVQTYDGLGLRRRTLGDADPEAAADLLVERIRCGDIALEQWDDKVEEWLTRCRCVASWFPERELVAYSEDDVAVILYDIVAGATRYSQIRRRPCLPHLRNALSWTDQQFVEQMAPPRIRLPGGYGMPVTYREGEPPRGRAKIQDLYGMRATPTVANGRQKVLLEILAPNFRPAQVTDDLAGFWKNTYPELKKELKRRYPKHKWR